VGIRIKQNHDPSSNPTPLAVGTEPGWVEHWFTAETPVVEFAVKPVGMALLANGTITPGVYPGFAVAKPTWTDCDSPALYIGAELEIMNLPTYDFIYMDLVQDVSFRGVNPSV
jgi:hypothetical protein